MSINYYLLGQFIVETQPLNTVEDCFKVYEKYINKLNFDGVVYSFIPTISLVKKFVPVFKYSNSYLSFLEHYIAEGFDKNDFTIREIQNYKLTPMDAWEYEKRNLLSLKERSVIQVAREDYDLTNTLSIPAMNSDMGISGTTVFSLEKKRLFSKIKQEQMETLIVLSKAFNELIISRNYFQAFLPTQIIDLKEKETYVLNFIISGKKMKELPEDYITQRYGEKLLRKIRKDFGDISTYELVYYASKYNLVKEV